MFSLKLTIPELEYLQRSVMLMDVGQSKSKKYTLKDKEFARALIVKVLSCKEETRDD
jgi:hypothetical protein